MAPFVVPTTRARPPLRLVDDAPSAPVHAPREGDDHHLSTPNSTPRSTPASPVAPAARSVVVPGAECGTYALSAVGELQPEHSQASTSARALAPTPACRLKTCKKVAKFGAEGELVMCTNSKCAMSVHVACSKHILASFDADPSFTASICGKRCYNAVTKAQLAGDNDPDVKKRVMWHNDDPTPSVSSMSCLLEWLTTGNNYNLYRGGKGQTGKTKEVMAGEVVRLIAESGITSVRTAKDVTTKIGDLEKAYHKAADWLNATGQGVEDESSLREAILDRCPYYYELHDTMEDRPSTEPLCTNKTVGDVEEDDVRYGAVSDDEFDLICEEESKSSEGTQPPPLRPISTPLSITTPKKGTYKSAKVSKKKEEEPPLSFLKRKEAQRQQDLNYQTMTLELRREKVELQRSELDLRSRKASLEERECDVRIEEAAARTKKLKTEEESLQLQMKVALLRERNRLKDDGIPQEEIDLILPLTAQL